MAGTVTGTKHRVSREMNSVQLKISCMSYIMYISNKLMHNLHFKADNLLKHFVL